MKFYTIPIVLLSMACTSGSGEDSGDTVDTQLSIDTSDSGGSMQPSTGLDTDFESTLGDGYGCGDYVLSAANTEDTTGLIVSGIGLAQQAHEIGEAITIGYDLPAKDIHIVAQVGEHITSEICNDTPVVEPVIELSYTPTAGSVTVTITPEGEPSAHGGFPASIEVVFDNVELSEDTETHVPVIIESLSLTAGIGWLPG